MDSILFLSMNPMRSTNSRRDEETKSTHNEDHNIHLQLRTEEERQRRRREWRLEQELLRQHEKLKRQMILDYERRRAEALKAKQKSSHHSRSRSRSKSPYRPNRRSTSKSDATFEKWVVSICSLSYMSFPKIQNWLKLTARQIRLQGEIDKISECIFAILVNFHSQQKVPLCKWS